MNSNLIEKFIRGVFSLKSMSEETETSRIEEFAKVWTPEASWSVPTAQDEATFIFPAFGPNVYNEVVKQVLANKQRLPTGEQDAFMLDEAYNSANQEDKDSSRTKFIRKNVMRDGWLWVPQVNCWTPKNIKNPGMYSIFDETGEGLSKERNVAELEDRLSGGSTERRVRFSKDRKVAFAPLNTVKSEYHKIGTLSQDGVFIANYGIEGAEKLDNIAKVFSYKSYSWIVDNTSDKLVQTLSALFGVFVGGRLDAGFNASGSNWGGYVLSVSGSKISAEGTAPKK